jgi:alpha-amylase
MGEVFGDDIGSVVWCFMRLRKVLMHSSRLASSYQQVMDSVLNYPLYDAIVQAFTIPGPANMSGLASVMGQIQNSFQVRFLPSR